jgi:hypothetical protein
MSDEIRDRLNEKLENSQVLSHEETRPGVHSMEIQVGENGLPARDLAYLTGKDGQLSPMSFRTDSSVISRDFLRRVDLDLLIGQPDPTRVRPEQSYAKALAFYRSKGAYGTIIDTLTNFAAKGFQNDTDDADIKLFYDTWSREIGLRDTVEKIFFDFFRVGIVRTLKVVGNFQPRLKPDNFQRVVKARASAHNFNTAGTLKELMAYRDYAAAKKIWSKSFIPLKYTVLDPRLIEIKGPLLFDQTETYLKSQAFTEIRTLLQNPAQQTKEQKAFIKSLPKELLNDIKGNKPVKLPSELVGKCDYRKQDYERYPMPKVLRAFDAMDYKDALVKADLSTLDGISNYILKITIGNDEHPVCDQAQLETVARLFDTASKSFNIVWNHTLAIEKITSPEISEILGQGKFEQVNDDLTMGWGVTRALIDGKLQGNSKAIEAAVKAFAEEVNYARRCVRRWIDHEYEEIALSMGFDRYPTARFDENALKDEIMLMSVIQGMLDRRIISYETGIEKLNLDFGNELANMKQEKPLVQDGTLGIIGSPYNPKALPAQGPVPETDTTDDSPKTVVTQEDLVDFQRNIEKMIQQGLKQSQPQVQPVQRTPVGTPSEGRPRKGGAVKPKGKATKPNTRPRQP